jgi:hypothetical protein
LRAGDDLAQPVVSIVGSRAAGAASPDVAPEEPKKLERGRATRQSRRPLQLSEGEHLAFGGSSVPHMQRVLMILLLASGTSVG